MANTYRDVADKSGWGPGPWTDEPDKATWVDPDTDLDCMIVRNHFGALCGYVGVSHGHPLYGADADRIDDLHVHGGLTYAGGCVEGQPEWSSLCHIPEPGRPAEVWWLGFDCGHGWDIQPGMEAQLRGVDIAPRRLPDATYRSWDYVVGQIADLAQQVRNVEAS